MKTTKCAVGHCERGAVKWGLCPVHGLTWVLTPESKFRGNAQRAALVDFVKRQDVRHALKAEVTT